MIKYGLSNRYKVDPYGTEEILSEVSKSVAPKLTIDYGDEVQEIEFTIRPTKGSLDTNISPIAVLNSIKGNTVAWNQLLNKSTFASTMVDCEVTFTNNDDGSVTVNGTATGGNAGFPLYVNAQNSLIPSHKYYVFGGSDGLFISDVYTGYFNSNVTFIWSAPSTLEPIHLFLKVPESNTVSNKRVYPQIIDLTLIYGAGNEPSTAEAFEADYYKWFGKQLTYEDYDAGSLRNCKMSGIKTTDVNSNLLGITSIPITSLKGKLNGEGSSVVVFPDGMKKAGTVYDEIVRRGDKTYSIKRVGSVDLGTLMWTKNNDEEGRFDSAHIDTVSVESTVMPNMVCGKYETIEWRNHDTSDKCVILDTTLLRAKDSSYSDAATFKTAMSGVMLYYELETPEEYVIDDVSIEKVMLGSAEINKIYKGSDVVFEQNS